MSMRAFKRRLYAIAAVKQTGFMVKDGTVILWSFRRALP